MPWLGMQVEEEREQLICAQRCSCTQLQLRLTIILCSRVSFPGGLKSELENLT